MWFKMDDGFAMHPKIVTAGHEALAVQIRAICYASQHHTDGFLLPSVIPYLTYDVSAHCPDWGQFMVEHHLWDRHESGYQIHDFLEWNMSKNEYDTMRAALSKAGKKGMKSRWKKRQSSDNQPYKPGYNLPNNETITLQSTSTSSLNPLNSPILIPDQSTNHSKKSGNGARPFPDEFVFDDSVKSNWASHGIDPGIEFAKFRDHHKARGTKFSDWKAAWRNWARNAIKFKEEGYVRPMR